jgi:hypothetical protein
MDQCFRLRVSVPRLGHVAVGSDETVPNQETSTGGPSPQGGTLVREANSVDAVNVADRITISVQHRRSHPLLLLEPLHLLRKFADLLLKIAGWCSFDGPRSVAIVRCDQRNQQQYYHEYRSQ